MGSSAADIQAEIERMIRTNGADEMREANRKLSAEAAAYARSIAPVGDSSDQHAGQFRDGIHDVAIPDRKGLPASQVRSDTPGAESIEYGTSRTPEHGTFARTEEEFGLQGRRIDDGASRGP